MGALLSRAASAPSSTAVRTVPAAAHKADQAAKLHDEMQAEIKALREARKELEEVRTAERTKAKLDYLRSVGAMDVLTDAHLLSLAPDIDPTTPDGRASWAWARGPRAGPSAPTCATRTHAKGPNPLPQRAPPGHTRRGRTLCPNVRHQ